MEYVRCVYVCLGAAWVERGGEWMRGLGLGFTNPVESGLGPVPGGWVAEGSCWVGGGGAGVLSV